VTADHHWPAHDVSETGMTRDAVAKALEIGAGTVSKILKEPRPMD
jgi:predicted transcriptional regulator